NMAGTMLMAKAPPTMLIRYRTPAILASCLGEVSTTESIKDLPQLVLMTLVPPPTSIKHFSQAGATIPPLQVGPLPARTPARSSAHRFRLRVDGQRPSMSRHSR